ncbi:butyrophilin-like protein 2 [Amia ocellicauda]|uniref:butyrophilin-like protein 2 n=1 Tax=Amia ocellicauda TaxID=2972642 RepID=UPI0034642242|nr:BTNL9 protein [Amia calva]
MMTSPLLSVALLEVLILHSSCCLQGGGVVLGQSGQDVLLQCLFPPQPRSAHSYLVVRWARDYMVVHYSLDGQELPEYQPEALRGRTQLSAELLAQGNASLLLHSATPGDSGNYTCSVTGNTLRATHTIQLHVEGLTFSSCISKPQVFCAILLVCLFVFKNLRGRIGGFLPFIVQEPAITPGVTVPQTLDQKKEMPPTKPKTE